jgi:hypothetical protein
MCVDITRIVAVARLRPSWAQSSFGVGLSMSSEAVVRLWGSEESKHTIVER